MMIGLKMLKYTYALAGNRTRVCCELRSVHYEQTFGVLVLALHACDRGADATVIDGRQLFHGLKSRNGRSPQKTYVQAREAKRRHQWQTGCLPCDASSYQI